MNNKYENKTIFESVRFINEFTGFEELIGMLGAMIIIGGIGVLSEKIPAKEKRKANNALIMYASKYKTVNDFNRKACKVKQISTQELLDVIKDDDDSNLIRSIYAKSYAIFDAKNNIMAYALFSNNLKDGYAYKICDKSFRNTPELNTFVKASFEAEAGFYGPGLKKILKFIPTTFNKDAYTNIKNSISISHNEYLEVLNNMKNIFDKLILSIKPLIESRYNDSYPSGIEVFNNKGIEFWEKSSNIMKEINPSLVASISYDYNDKDFDEDSIDIIMDKVKNTIKTLGFKIEEHEYYNGITAKENDKYPNISINFYDVGDDNCMYLEVYAVKHFIIN